MKRKITLIKVYRIKDWYYYLGFILLGFLLVSSPNLKLFVLLLFGSFLLAYAYSFNQFYDKKEKAYFIFPLFTSFFFFIFLNFLQIIISLLFLFIATIYSGPPRLKAKPFLSSLCNGIGFSLLFLLGYSTKTLDLFAFLLFSIFFCFNMVAQFIHEIIDLKEDKKAGDITTAVWLGEKNVKKLCYSFLFLAALISLYLFFLNLVSYLFVGATLFFTTFFIYRIFTGRINKKLRKEYKIFGMLTGLLYLISIIIYL